MPTKNDYQPPFFFQNLEKHMVRTFDLWSVKKPTVSIHLQRLLTFFSALLVTIYWPVTNLMVEFILLLLAWIMLSLIEKPVLRWLLMLNLMLNIAWLYLLMQYFLLVVS